MKEFGFPWDEVFRVGYIILNNISGPVELCTFWETVSALTHSVH